MYCQQNGNEQVYEQETVLPEIEKKDENLAQLSSNYHNENKNKDEMEHRESVTASQFSQYSGKKNKLLVSQIVSQCKKQYDMLTFICLAFKFFILIIQKDQTQPISQYTHLIFNQF